MLSCSPYDCIGHRQGCHIFTSLKILLKIQVLKIEAIFTTHGDDTCSQLQTLVSYAIEMQTIDTNISRCWIRYYGNSFEHVNIMCAWTIVLYPKTRCLKWWAISLESESERRHFKKSVYRENRTLDNSAYQIYEMLQRSVKVISIHVTLQISHFYRECVLAFQVLNRKKTQW